MIYVVLHCTWMFTFCIPSLNLCFHLLTPTTQHYLCHPKHLSFLPEKHHSLYLCWPLESLATNLSSLLPSIKPIIKPFWAHPSCSTAVVGCLLKILTFFMLSSHFFILGKEGYMGLLCQILLSNNKVTTFPLCLILYQSPGNYFLKNFHHLPLSFEHDEFEVKHSIKISRS